MNTAYSSQGIINLGTNISVTDTITSTTEINLLDNLSSGIIDASSVTTLTGNTASANTMYDSAVTTGDGSTDGISNLGNEVVILSDSIVDSSTLTSIVVASTEIFTSEVTRIQEQQIR